MRACRHPGLGRVPQRGGRAAARAGVFRRLLQGAAAEGAASRAAARGGRTAVRELRRVHIARLRRHVQEPARAARAAAAALARLRRALGARARRRETGGGGKKSSTKRSRRKRR